MSVENGKVCCNCRRNIRKEVNGRIVCYCELDNSIIGYVQCLNYWCRHWARDKKEWDYDKIHNIDR